MRRMRKFAAALAGHLGRATGDTPPTATASAPHRPAPSSARPSTGCPSARSLDGFPTAPDRAHRTVAEPSGTDAPSLVRPLGGQYVPTERANFRGVGSDLGPTGDLTAWRTTATAGSRSCAEVPTSTPTSYDLRIDDVAPSPRRVEGRAS